MANDSERRERDSLARLVPIAEVPCDFSGCKNNPTHQCFEYDVGHGLVCEEHGRIWVREMLPEWLREDGA